jgi:molybdopterin-guanine dinucleotide biosynthesis protein A
MVLSGQRVLPRILNVLRQFPFQRVAVITARGKEKDWPESIVTIRDDQEGLGPIGGITTALRHLPGGILLTACDMPFVSGELIAWLLDHYDPHVDAVIPRHPAGIEPLFGIYEKNFLPALEKAIRSDCYGLHVVLEGAKVRFVDVPDKFSAEREFANINTLEDYERVLKLMEEKI